MAKTAKNLDNSLPESSICITGIKRHEAMSQVILNHILKTQRTTSENLAISWLNMVKSFGKKSCKKIALLVMKRMNYPIGNVFIYRSYAHEMNMSKTDHCLTKTVTGVLE